MTPDNSRVGCERSAPQRVTEDDEIQISCGLIVRRENATQRGRDAEDTEKVRRDDAGSEPFGAVFENEINRRLPAAIPEFDDREIAEYLRG